MGTVVNHLGDTSSPTDRWKVYIVSAYLLSVVVYSYPPFIVEYAGTSVFRVDFLLAIPLFLLLIRERVVTGPPVVKYVIAFLVVVVVSALLNTTYSHLNFITLFVQLSYVSVVFITLSFLDLTPAEWISILRILCLGLLALALFGLLEFVTINLFRGSPLSALFIFADQTQVGYYHRPRSLFQEPTWFGGMMLVGIAILFPCWGADEPVLFPNITVYLGIAVMFAALLSTLSFTSYLTLPFMLAVFLLFKETRRPAIAILLATGILVVAFVLSPIPVPVPVKNRIDRLALLLLDLEPPSSGSLQLRLGSIVIAFKVWMGNPIFGVSLGQYFGWQQYVKSITVFGVSYMKTAHSVWFQVLSLTGIVGFLAFSSIWVRVLRMFASTLDGASGVDRILLIMGVATTITILANWGLGQSLVDPMRWGILAFMFSLVVAHSNQSQI